MSLPAPVPGIEPGDGPLIDRFARVHDYLRVSVTDRCNFRCTYCMPAEGFAFLPRPHLLTYEELTRVVRVFVGLGVRRVRLTGGEPTIRRGIVDLVGMLAAIPGLDELSMTTNGLAFRSRAGALARAGLTRVNISLDTLDPERFAQLTRGGDVHKVLASIEAAVQAGLTPVKVNCVVIGGVNDGDVEAMAAYFAERPGTQLRFIEYMPFDSSIGTHVPVAELRERLGAHQPVPALGGGPSVDHLLPSGQRVGFISPITEHFCERCNRLRLQADGSLRTCLSRDRAPNLRDLLRQGATDEDLEVAIRRQVFAKVAGHEAHLDEGFRGFEGVMTQIGG